MQAIMLSCFGSSYSAPLLLGGKEAMYNVANAFALFHQIIKAKRKVHEMTKCFIRFSTIKKDGSLPKRQEDSKESVKWKDANRKRENNMKHNLENRMAKSKYF